MATTSIKFVVLEAADTVEKVIESLADGFQLTEDGFVILSEFNDVKKIVEEAPKAWAERKDLTPAEATALVEELAEEFNLSNDLVEARVEWIFAKAAELYHLVGLNIAFVKSLSSYPKKAA